MRRRRSPLLALCPLLGVALALAGCVERLLDFKVHQLSGIRVVGIDGTGFDMRVRCELENPNAVGAELSGVRFRTHLGEHLIGAGQLEGLVQAPARSRFTLEAPVRVAYGDLPADLPQRAAGGMMELRTEAVFRARSPLGSYSMRLVSQGQTRIAEALQIAVQGPFQGDAVVVENVSLAGVELRRVKLLVRLALRNRFAFPIRVQRGTFDVDVNGTRFGTSTLDQPLLLPARGSVATTMLITASHGTVGSVVTSMVASDPRFRVRGALWIDPIGGVGRIPLDVRADSSIFGK